MFRTAGIALLGLLTLAVVVVVVGGWQFQRNLASRTEQLSEQLAALTATQQAMLAQQRPPEITGLCYLGDRSQPAANVELQVCRFSEQPSGGSAMPGRRGVVTRRVRTDERGRFTSGGLPEGDYCLLAPLQRTDGKHDEAQPIFNTLQSRPVYSLTGGGSEAVDFDLLPHAQIELECDGSLPDTIKIGEHQFQILISADVWPLPLMSGHFPLAPSDEPANRRWPLPGNIGSGPGASVDSSPSKLPRSAALPAFDYHINVRLSISPPPVVAETADDDSHPAVRRIPQFGDAGLGARRFALDGGSAFYSVVEVHDIRAGERLKIRVSLIGEPLADRVPALLAAAEESRTFSKGAVAQPNYEPIVLNNMAQALARDIKLDVKVTREPIESEALSAK